MVDAPSKRFALRAGKSAGRLRGDFIADPCAEQERSAKPAKERGRGRPLHLDSELAGERAAVLLHQHRDDLRFARLAHSRNLL